VLTVAFEMHVFIRRRVHCIALLSVALVALWRSLDTAVSAPVYLDSGRGYGVT